MTSQPLNIDSEGKNANLINTIFNTAGIALGIIDSERIITRVNHYFVKLSGYSKQEIEGKMKWSDFVLPQYIKPMSKFHENRRNGIQAPKEYECEVRTKHGSSMRVQVNIDLIPGTKETLFTLQNLTELSQGQVQYGQLFDSSVTGIFVHDEEGNIIDVNQKTLDMLGYTREEFLPRKWGDSLDESEKEKGMAVFKSLFEEGYYNEISKLTTKDGDVIDVEMIGSVFEVDGSKYVQSHVIDVTDQLRLEERYQGFMQSATDSFSIFDDQLNLVDVNQKWIQETKRKREDVIGMNMLDVFPYLQGTQRYEAYMQVLDTGVPVEFKSTVNNLLPGRFFDVKAFKMKDSLGLISSEVTDKIVYQKRLEALHSHGVLLSAAESMDEVAEITQSTLVELIGFYVGGLWLVNGEILELQYQWGVDASEFNNLPLNGSGITVNAVRTGQTQNISNVKDSSYFVSGNVNTRTLSELCVPILVSGEVIGVINVESEKLNSFSEADQRLVETFAQHVASVYTRLKDSEKQSELERELLVREVQLEQELELNQLKTRFMSTATHEIRTPLTSILGYTDLIQIEDQELSQKQRMYFDVIRKNVNRLSKLTDDLLDVQRLEESRMTLDLELIDMRNLLDDVLTEILPLIMNKKQSIITNCENVLVKADPLRVMQVLVNLISNASKFSPENGEINVDVTTDDESMYVTIKDEGIGIKQEDLAKLFIPFPGILVDGNVSGTGLGLSICKGIIDLHGGQIYAKSQGEGKGSSFTFKLPLS